MTAKSAMPDSQAALPKPVSQKLKNDQVVIRGFLLPPADTGFHLELTSQKPQRIVIREKLWGSAFFRHYRVLRHIPCVKVVIMRRIPVLRHVVTLPRHRLKENTFRFGFAL